MFPSIYPRYYFPCQFVLTQPRHPPPNIKPKSLTPRRPLQTLDLNNNNKSIHEMIPFKNMNVKDIDIFEYIKNHTITQTRDHFGVGSYRINRILSEMDGSKRHKRKTTDEIDDFIVETANSGIIYANEIARLIFLKFNLLISHDTVNRRLIENKYKFRNPRHIQMLSKAQVFNRYNFCYNLLNNISYNLSTITRRIIFTDECRICGGPDCSKRWFRSDDYSEFTTISTEKFSISVMIFAAIGYNYISDVYFIEGSLNTDKYINLLIQSDLFKKLNDKFGPFNYLYEQDGAPCHTTQKSIKFIEQNARILYGWPPNSPDLSPIEMIWAIVKRKLQKLNYIPKNKEELKEAIRNIWKTIKLETVNSLIDSFQYRIQMCHDVGGQSISHYLSNHKHDIPEEDKAKEFPLLLTPDDNYNIYQQNQKNPRKWKDNSKILSPNIQIEPSSLRIKCNELDGKIRDYTNHVNLFNQVPLDISVIGRHLNLVNCTRNSHPERENDYSSDDENND